MQIRSLSHSCSIREMAEFLASCEGGVPIKEFNARSNKRHIDLYRELRGERGREIEIYQDPETGVARRKAKSSKGIICNEAEHAVLVEVSRTYRNGKTVLNFPESEQIPLNVFSISETMILGEHSLDTLLRGMREELSVNTDKLNLKKIQETRYTSTDIHPSTAYAGVESEVESFWHIVKTYQLAPRFEIPYKRDSGVTINRKWFIDRPAAIPPPRP